ncbi:MAG: c-type cytochrome domain-containing protein, partial [Verrucomicrobiota bacterium]|nr:c-type cytochrome domain-containing protein [Verrucomicrobiota bacterium]
MKLHPDKTHSLCMISALAAVGIGLLAAPARSELPTGEKDLQFFERRIRPVLVNHCYECHSADSKKVGGNLYLDHAEGLLQGGESGPAIVPGRPDESLLIQAIRKTDDDLVMPPEDKDSLPPTALHDLVEWVKRGAPDPRTSPGENTPPKDESDETALWSFQPVSNPSPPRTRNPNWPLDDIDRFILSRLESLD